MIDRIGRGIFIVVALTSSICTDLIASRVPVKSSSGTQIAAGYLTMELDDRGTVTGLIDARTNTNYLASRKSVPLVSLVVLNSDAMPIEEKPTAMSVEGNDTLIFTMADATVTVGVTRHATYTTLNVTGITPTSGVDVETLLWGPLPLSLGSSTNDPTHDSTQYVGEAVGIVRNSAFAIGIHPLNDKTIGAWPNEFSLWGFGADLSTNPYKLKVDTMYEWGAAEKSKWGSVLRAYTYDYSKARTRIENDGFSFPQTFSLGPLKGRDSSIAGSSIALFGTTPEMAPTILDQIETDQNLPHPTIHGQWQKVAQATTASEFWVAHLTTDSVSTYSQLAHQAGITRIHDANKGDNGGPWQSKGSFQVNTALGGQDSGMASVVKNMRAYSVVYSVHTLSDYISANDPYLAAPAYPNIVTTGFTYHLTRVLARTDSTLYVDSPAIAFPAPGLHILRIGNEFIRFTNASQVSGSTTEWQVTGLIRGYWGSSATSHTVGDAISINVNDGHENTYGALPLIHIISDRLSSLFNSTGIKGISFDGVESASKTGWGAYGISTIENDFYRRLTASEASGLLIEGSRIGSNTWDVDSRMSWGEPYPVTSISQIIQNNVFHRANYLPSMMGQSNLGAYKSLPPLEQELAVGAGLNGGSQYTVYAPSDASPAKLVAIKTWEAARNAGVFPTPVKTQLANLSNYWHLTQSTNSSGQPQWTLQQTDSNGNTLPGVAPQTFYIPKPVFVQITLPAMIRGLLYEAHVQSNVPTTARYAITAGKLPSGLILNADTGGITGDAPTGSACKTSKFIITAYDASGAQQTHQAFSLRCIVLPPSVG